MNLFSPERQKQITLADGRCLAWSEWGPEAGLPLLFCTGAGMSGCLGFGTEYLAQFKLRLLAIDRPGLGLSSPDPAKTLKSWVEDIRFWQQALGFKQLVAVGFSQGAPFAYALAAAGLLQQLAIVAGQDDFHQPQVRALLHPDVAQMVTDIETQPDEFYSRFIRFADAQGLWQLIISMSSQLDQGFYLSDHFNGAYQQALLEGFSQGPAGYVRDLVNTFSPWPFQLEEILCPVTLWYGQQDQSSVHSPDYGLNQSQRLPQAELKVVSEAGGALLWQYAEQILSPFSLLSQGGDLT